MKRSIKTKTNTWGVLCVIKVRAGKGFPFPHCLGLYLCTWVRCPYIVGRYFHLQSESLYYMMLAQNKIYINIPIFNFYHVT